MNTIRPALSNQQIDTLKTDIKLISRVLKNFASCKSFPVLSIQNAVAKRMKFTSFSELTLHAKRPHNDLVPFSLFEEINADDLQGIYGTSYNRYYPSVIIDIQGRQDAPKAAKLDNGIDALVFKEAYDVGEINGGLLNLATGLPSYGKLSEEQSQLCTLSEGDQFNVVLNGQAYPYTVMERTEMMDTGLKVLAIQEGCWYSTPSGAIRIS